MLRIVSLLERGIADALPSTQRHLAPQIAAQIAAALDHPAADATVDPAIERAIADLGGELAIATSATSLQLLRDQYNLSGTFDRSTITVGGVAISLQFVTDDRFDVSDLRPINPYRGLAAYAIGDARLFGGRAAEIADALARLTSLDAARALLITGPSGCGKSSFVLAGLIPVLDAYAQRQGLTCVMSVLRPGTHPRAALLQLLETLGVPPLPDADLARVTAHAIAAQLLTTLPAGRAYILVLDQFEECLRIADPADRDLICGLPAALRRWGAVPIWLLATMRNDYLADAMRLAALDALVTNQLRLGALQGIHLRDAILRPIEQTAPDRRFASALLRRLVADAGLDSSLLPLLQVALTQLWDGGKLEDQYYGSLGDAIEQLAERVYTHWGEGETRRMPRTAPEQRALEQLLLDLVETSEANDGRGDLRRRRSLDALLGGRADRRALIDDLLRARLLSTSGEREVEIIHEALLVRWPRLQKLIESERERLRQRRRFETQLWRWEHVPADTQPQLLLTGLALAEAEALAVAEDIALQSAEAKQLLAASRTASEAAQQREIAAARQLARVERQARWRAQLLAAMLFCIASASTALVIRPWVLRWWAIDAVPTILVPGMTVVFEQSETSNDRYRLCVDAGACAAPLATQSTFFDTGRGALPVTGVDPLQSAQFCAWIDRRLPTLAQWNAAALNRSGRGSDRDWEQLDRNAYLAPIFPFPTVPLTTMASLSHTPEGIFDLIGNVWEWTSSDGVHTEDEWQIGDDEYPSHVVVVGGSYQSSIRLGPHPEASERFALRERFSDLGFRCVAAQPTGGNP